MEIEDFQKQNCRYLLSYLTQKKILSKDKILLAIEEGMPGYNCYTWEDLRKKMDVDTDESRVHEPYVELRKVILKDAPRNLIRFTNCISVKLVDCVFFCDVNFAMDRMNSEGGVEGIILDNCLIFGDLSFVGYYPDLSLSWLGLCCYELSFYNTQIKRLSICESNIFHLSCNYLTASDYVSIVNNNITLLEFHPRLECDFTDHNNHYEPKNLPAIKYEHKEGINKYSRLKDKFDLFKFAKYRDESEKPFSLYDTYSTLRKSNDNSKSVGFRAKLDYLFYLHYPRLNIMQKWITYLTHAFLSPMLFFIYSVIVIISAAVLYYNFDQQACKTFYSALYFSVITFTTTGYGDITPSGGMKIVACAESILGVILVSCFTVSLVRKYFENK